MKKMDKKSISVISDTFYVRLIASYGLVNAKKIWKEVNNKLKTETKRRKDEEV